MAGERAGSHDLDALLPQPLRHGLTVFARAVHDVGAVAIDVILCDGNGRPGAAEDPGETTRAIVAAHLEVLRVRAVDAVGSERDVDESREFHRCGHAAKAGNHADDRDVQQRVGGRRRPAGARVASRLTRYGEKRGADGLRSAQRIVRLVRAREHERAIGERAVDPRSVRQEIAGHYQGGEFASRVEKLSAVKAVKHEDGVARQDDHSHDLAELARARAAPAGRHLMDTRGVIDAQLRGAHVADDDPAVRQQPDAHDAVELVGRVAFDRADADDRLGGERPAAPVTPRGRGVLDDADARAVAHDRRLGPIAAGARAQPWREQNQR